MSYNRSGYAPSFVPQRNSRPYSRNSGGGRGGSYKRSGGREKNSWGIRKDQIGGKLKQKDWAQEQLTPFVRQVWTGHPEPVNKQRTEEWRRKTEVIAEGDSIPDPIFDFTRANLPGPCVQKMQQLGFTEPTPIQAQGWPMVLAGRDVVGIAETGSGKTLAFVLPGIMHIQGQPITSMQQNWGQNGPVALVVAPTRELAIQIKAETAKFAYCMGVSVTCVYGGAPRKQQEREMRSGMQFLIATPGRLLDFLERGSFTLKTCSYCVFDEADRMLDMGFEPQIRALMSQVRPDRQMLMWSATWPKEVQTLARDFLAPNRLFLKVGDESKAAVTVTQKVEVMSRIHKQRRLAEILNQFLGQKVLIFSGTKRMCDELTRNLSASGFSAAAMHGDKEQWQREQSLQDFKQGKVSILVATDVASRGIDISDLALVLNYDFPQNCEDYIHRVGRTGRAGKLGTAITFFDPRNDSKHSRKLVALLQKNNQEIPPQLLALSQSNSGRFGGRNRYRNNRGRGNRSYKPY